MSIRCPLFLCLLLIAEGAHLKVRCNKGYTALDYAKATNTKATQRIIEEAIARK
ncbi:hypothetical protein [Formosa sp. L2A11]|uniref:hypothetical protein n=1 Tax=Formosa sp. L2A11 TaxID=2686363 RepID=UPI00131D19DF|nr:hypothetical protein [Formosa sp. L2A11]